MAYNRQTARKCRISHLLNGRYVQREGWDPNYVETSIGNISRVNVIGVVVGKDNGSLTIDDGSGKISLRSFEGIPLMDFELGERLLIIARPRAYNNNMYLAAEIVKKVNNDKWLEHRQVEMSLLQNADVKEAKEVTTVEMTDEEDAAKPQTDILLEKIRELDNGQGADVEEVLKGFEKGDRILSILMEEGEIFELKPGKVKVLD